MSCGLINLTANFLGFVIAIALTPALDKETPSAVNVTFTILFINLGIALGLLILGSICKKDDRHSDKLERDD